MRQLKPSYSNAKPSLSRLTGAVADGKPRRPPRRCFNALELKAIWNQLASMKSAASLALRVQLLTGQRPGQILNLRCCDLDSGWWSVQGMSGRSHQIFLAQPVQQLIETALGQRRSGLVFGGRLADQPLSRSAYNKVFHQACIKTGLQGETRPQDFRFTFAIWLSEQKVEVRIRSILLGTMNERQEMVSPYLDEERKRWFTAYADYVMAGVDQL